VISFSDICTTKMIQLFPGLYCHYGYVYWLRNEQLWLNNNFRILWMVNSQISRFLLFKSDTVLNWYLLFLDMTISRLESFSYHSSTLLPLLHLFLSYHTHIHTYTHILSLTFKHTHTHLNSLTLVLILSFRVLDLSDFSLQNCFSVASSNFKLD